MTKRRPRLLLLTALLLAGCAAPPAGEEGGATQALAAYLQALAGKDEAGVRRAVCPDWETDALLEFDAFAAVETSLDGLDCQQTGSADSAVLVTCTGKLIASYSGEAQEFDLDRRTYRLVPQGDDWQVCGYSLD